MDKDNNNNDDDDDNNNDDEDEEDESPCNSFDLAKNKPEILRVLHVSFVFIFFNYVLHAIILV